MRPWFFCSAAWRSGARTARISGAVIASGTLEVAGSRQVVQHPDGGVVTEILARDGDLVAAGDVLLRLEGGRLEAELEIVEGQLFEVVAEEDRLAAQRDAADAVTFSAELMERAPDMACDRRADGRAERPVHGAPRRGAQGERPARRARASGAQPDRGPRGPGRGGRGADRLHPRGARTRARACCARV